MATILVIDDESGVRHLLATMLQRKGYQVVLAENGQNGLDLFRRERPDVIILDLKMPDMDGLSVLRQLRALDVERPVIVMTGAGNEEIECEARLLGAAAFIRKEFSLHELGDTLKHVLPTSHSIQPG